MTHRLGRGAVLAAALAAALCPAALSGCTLSQLRSALESRVVQPAIVPVASESGVRNVEREFRFEDAVVSLAVPVDMAVYAGAKRADKRAIFLTRERPEDWVAGYYRAFASEKHQEPFLAALASALEQVREARRLDDPRFVELAVALAQSLRYQVDPGDLAPKFPIETFADGYGDCDDKTLLAAAILSRAGFDVAVLFFAPEQHVALGVRAPGLDFRGTGYAYVEMTTPSLVGVPPDRLADGTRLTSAPRVVRIGDGTKVYGAGDRIRYITRRLDRIRAEVRRLAAEIRAERSEIESAASRLEAEREALLAGPGAPTPEAVAAYNARVRALNERVSALNRAVARHNELVEAERFAAEHPFARPQVYTRLRTLRL